MPYPRTGGAMPLAGTRQDQFTITLEVNGKSWGFWDKKTGGEIDSDEVKYYPGGTDQSVSLGGRLTPGNVTLQRLFDRFDDSPRIPELFQAVGKKEAVVTQRPMDRDGNPQGRRIVWTGTLKRVLIPDVDSEATSAALLEVEITVAGRPQSLAAS
jgi:hypothetical protein